LVQRINVVYVAPTYIKLLKSSSDRVLKKALKPLSFKAFSVVLQRGFEPRTPCLKGFVEMGKKCRNINGFRAFRCNIGATRYATTAVIKYQ